MYVQNARYFWCLLYRNICLFWTFTWLPDDPLYMPGKGFPCTALHSAALHNPTLHCITLHYTALHWTRMCMTALNCTARHCTALHFTNLVWPVLLFTALHCTALPCTSWHCRADSASLVQRFSTLCRLYLIKIVFRIFLGGYFVVVKFIILMEGVT